MRESTPSSSVLTRIYRAIEWTGRTLFARSDLRARDRGWQVLETGRLNRHYRDPRFAQFARCGWCEGRGCDTCDWTGRLVRGTVRIGR
jgi:hypothetical protein